jgi:hypothetical protein
VVGTKLKSPVIPQPQKFEFGRNMATNIQDKNRLVNAGYV